MAMFGIMISHFFNKIIKVYEGFAIDMNSLGNASLWLCLETIRLLSLTAVDCFVLISGYFLITKLSFRKRGILKVWSQTWFYSVAIAVVVLVAGFGNVSWIDVLASAVPLILNKYWFVTSYILLMLCAPFLSKLASNLTKKQYQLLLLVGLIICFEFPFGYLIMTWQQFPLFVLLYFTGGYIRLFIKKSDWRQWAAAGAVILFAIEAYCLAKNIIIGGLFQVFSMTYYGFLLPLSVCVFGLFLNLNIQGRAGRIINFIAPFTFSAYLIESHPLANGWIWSVVGEYTKSTTQMWLPIQSITIALIILCVSIAVDFCRHFFARKLSFI